MTSVPLPEAYPTTFYSSRYDAPLVVQDREHLKWRGEWLTQYYVDNRLALHYKQCRQKGNARRSWVAFVQEYQIKSVI